MKIALAQINTTVGDLAGNRAKILAAYRRGVEAGADLVMLPELTITGYPPRDLLLKKSFIAGNLAVLDELAAATGKTGLLVGYVGENKSRPGREAVNFVALLQNGKIAATRAKTLLPTYDVFDEDRYFEPATENLPVTFDGAKNRPDDLRGHLERRGFLAGTALPAQSAAGTRGGRGAGVVQRVGVAVVRGQGRDALPDAAKHGGQGEMPGDVLQPGWRE